MIINMKTQKKGEFDRDLVSKLVEVLGEQDPYYMQLAYAELKLQTQADINNKYNEILERLDKLENNHIKHIMEDVYNLAKTVEDLRMLYERGA